MATVFFVNLGNTKRGIALLGRTLQQTDASQTQTEQGHGRRDWCGECCTSSTSHSTSRIAQISGEEDSRSYAAAGVVLSEYAAVAVNDERQRGAAAGRASSRATGTVDTSVEAQFIRERWVGERRSVDGIR